MLEKLDGCSKKGCSIEYNTKSPSYLLYYLHSNSVLRCRVVRFTEKFEINKLYLEDCGNDDLYISENSISQNDPIKSEIVVTEKVEEDDPHRYPVHKS